MNNERIAKLEKELNDIMAEIKQLKSEEQSKEIKPWRAEYNSEYYYVTHRGTVDSYNDEITCVDNDVFRIGNYYRTKDLAEQDAKELALRGRVRQLRDALCEGYQFENGEYNYFIYKNKTYRKYTVGSAKHCHSIAGIFFDTLKHAQQACNILNHELANGNIKI